MTNVTLPISKAMMSEFSTFGISIGLAALLLTGCGGGGKEQVVDMDAGSPVKGEWVIVHELSDAEGLNPITVNDASARAIFDRVYEKLLDQDFVTTDLVGSLAEGRPTMSDDHLTYTFKLKQGVTFSDGHPLTAADVVFSFKVVKNPLIIDAAPLRNYYEDLKDVVAPDANTVVVTMNKPYFMAEFQLGDVRVCAKHIQDPKNLTDQYTFAETNDMAKAQANKAMGEFATWYNRAEMKREPKMNLGSGPYVFEEWKTQESITIARNPTYWAAGKNKDNPAYVDKVIYRVMNDRSAAVTALKNQELDFMESLPPAKFAEEVDTTRLPYLVKHPFEAQYYTYIGWNTVRPVLSDKRVRRALSHLVDRPAMIKQVMHDLAVPMNSPIYPQRPEYDKTLPNINYNTKAAAALLAQAGWKDSNGDGTLDKMINGKLTDCAFTFLLNAGNEAREQVALLIVDECKKIGINATVKKLEWAVFLENLRTRKFDAYIGAWVNDPIPSDPYQIWHSSQADNKGSNYVSFRNKRADELMELNRTEFDEAKRAEYMREFQRIVVDEQPYTFLWMPQYPCVYNKRLHNVQFSQVRPGYNPTQWWVPTSQWKYAPAQ